MPMLKEERPMKDLASRNRYFELSGRLEQYDDLPDGAWWAACESECGGYDNFMAYLEAGKVYEPELYKEPK